MRVLARGGARLDAAPKEGFSPLRTAIERRRAEMQAVLLDLGAKDLHSAARLDDPVMVQHCLADGALPDTLDHVRPSPSPSTSSRLATQRFVLRGAEMWRDGRRGGVRWR